MNPRIQELMVELKKTVSTHRGAEVLAGYDEIEKFAELIVRECMTVTKDYTCNQGWDYSAPVALARHFGFGVEEWNNYLTNCSTKPSTAVTEHRFGVEQ